MRFGIYPTPFLATNGIGSFSLGSSPASVGVLALGRLISKIVGVSFPVPEPWQNLQRLRAAEGWIELGLLEEARVELAEIGPELRNGADGLEVQWRLFSELGQWDAAFAVAEQAVELHPDSEAGWIHRSYAARRRPTGGVEFARSLLLEAIPRFPKSAILYFNLACYSARLGEPEEAWVWLTQSVDLVGWRIVCEMGLKDSDLESLWPQLLDKAPGK